MWQASASKSSKHIVIRFGSKETLKRSRIAYGSTRKAIVRMISVSNTSSPKQRGVDACLDFYYMAVLVLSRCVLLVIVWARNLVRNPNFFEE